MIIFKLIVNIAVLIFLIKTISLLWSLIAFKINYKKSFKEKSSEKFNDENYKGRILICVLLDHLTKEAMNIANMYFGVVLGYKNAQVLFITNEKEEIEVKMRHNDDKTTRQVISEYLGPLNRQLGRKDALKLVHYPYDNDSKAQMIDFAVKEYLTDNSTIDKMISYVGIFEGSSIVEDALLARLDKTVTTHRYPHVVEAVKVRTFNVFKIKKIKNYMHYIHNANWTCNNIIKNNFHMNFRKFFGLNKVLPYNSELDGTFIRMDYFYEEEMLSSSIMPESIFTNYYLKNGIKKVIYTEVDERVINHTINMNKDLEKEHVIYHNVKKQSSSIKKYRRVSKLRNILLHIHNNSLMLYNAFASYLVFFALMFLIFDKSLSLNLLIAFLSSMYLYAFLMIITYRLKSKCYDKDEMNFKKFIIRVLSFILYPLYLIYRFNGFYDYVRTRSLVNSKEITDVKGIR